MRGWLLCQRDERVVQGTLEAGGKMRIGPSADVPRDIPDGELVLLKLSLPIY
jgi:hypothetical protein